LKENAMKRLVLVVEDDPVLQKAMTAHLEGMDFEVVTALHYDGAVQMLATRKPHLVCVNLELPVQSGFELCEYIRGTLGNSVVSILVTGDSGFPRDMANAEEAGANAYLKKPFTMVQLTAYVEALFQKIHQSQPHMRRLQL